MPAIYLDHGIWTVFWSVMVFVWGACIGSFLNVCIYRIPAEISVVKPRSNCPHCHTPIAWYDNLPVLAYLYLRARCRHCKAPISIRYPMIEALTGILFLAVWLKFGFGLEQRPLGLAPITNLALVPVYWLVVSGLILATFVDLDHMIIPDRVSIGGIVAGIALSACLPALHNTDTFWHSLMLSSIGAATGFFSLWGVALLGQFLFKKEAMGFGDVKLLGAIGAFFGVRSVFFVIMMSSLIGSIIGVSLIATKRRGLQARIPFGPFLALGALFWLLWGPLWWDWYIALVMSPDLTL